MRTWPGRLGGALRPALIDKVERDHRQSDREFLRRRIVVGITLVDRGDAARHLANVDAGQRDLLPADHRAGRHLGDRRLRLRAAAPRPDQLPRRTPPTDRHSRSCSASRSPRVFILGAVVVRNIEPLRDITENVLAFARYGSLPLVAIITLMNGIAEEIFFRGALFAAIGIWHPVAISTVIYTLTTVATGNVMLVFSAALLGVLLGLQRRASGGILGPILTHCTWSMTMLLVLPPVFAAAG